MGEITAELTEPGQFFEMEELVIRGVATRTWKNAPTTLRTIAERTRQHGDRAYVVYEDEVLTYAENYTRMATLAHALIDDFGVQKGDRVAIAMRNFPEWPTAFWAAASVGAIVVPLNAWWTGPELEYGIEDSGTNVVIADAERMERLEGRLDKLDVRSIVVRGEDTPGGHDFEAIVSGGEQHEELPPIEIAPDDDATIFYTSGTTGRSKARSARIATSAPTWCRCSSPASGRHCVANR